MRRFGQLVGRQHRVIGRGVVDGAGDRRQQAPEIALVEQDLDMLGADRQSGGTRRRPLVGRRCRQSRP